MALFCGLDYYTSKDIKVLMESESVDGIVLGDLFCQKKMFDFGEVELYEFINIVGNSSKKLIYQTPIYVTSRNRMQVIDIINHINASFAGSIVLTQDIGIIKFIADTCPNIELVWSRMGRTRDYSFNHLFYKALCDLKIKLFETDSLVMAMKLSEHNIQPLLVYGSLHYKTIGRRCYSKYELDIKEDNCSLYCRNSKYKMETPDATCKMTIDGYILGSKLSYNAGVAMEYERSKDKQFVVYAKDMDDLQLRLSEFL